MSDLPQLLDAFAAGTHVRPAADRPNLVALSRAIMRAADAPAVHEDPVADALRVRIGDADHLVFVVADGCGMNFVDGLPEAAFLRRHLDRPIDSVFPSSTGPAMTSISTADWPGRHGFLAWFTHLPALGEAATPYPWVTMRDGTSLTDLGIRREDVFLGPRAFDRCGRDAMMLMPAAVVGSPASVSTFDPERLIGIESLCAGVDRIVARVRAATEPTFTYLYWPSVDILAHDLGSSHTNTLAEVAHVDAELARMHAELAERVRMVVTADHGHLDFVDEEKIEVAPDGEIAATLTTRPAGEARILYLHARAGEARRFEDLFREHAGEHFFLLTLEEVDELRLLAPDPLAEAVRARVGTHVAIARGHAGIEFCEPGRHRAMRFVSMHGGLTADEMRVPLVLA
jgi:hypothetical protein